MEVHAHTHTPRKKWAHYFWEFLMLFLAVFCGFLAENKREHMVEHQREKQFMRSLAEDLATDTLELITASAIADTVILYSDSALHYLTTYKPGATVPYFFSGYIGKGGRRQNPVFTDRTASQLKNSGAMRMIREKKVTDGILHYWKQVEESKISQERYMLYRNSIREIIFKILVIPEVYEYGFGMKRTDLQELRVIDKDPRKWEEMANLFAINRSITHYPHKHNLEKQRQLARELITLIKTEYHLE